MGPGLVDCAEYHGSVVRNMVAHHDIGVTGSDTNTKQLHNYHTSIRDLGVFLIIVSKGIGNHG